ncbi:MAG: exosortase-associated EpsI family protein [Verrucomicrobia bacterium]|nr:exosortase-associated EpsI family protein [Verrucomicrobiota bacterium]
MNKEKWIVLAVALALTGGVAAFLNVTKDKQRLGLPGLKMVQQDVLGEYAKVVGTNTVALPPMVLGYVGMLVPVMMTELTNLPPDTTFAKRRYQSKDKAPIDVSVVLMGKDRTSIHKPEICLTGQGWRIESSEFLTIPILKPHLYELPVMKLTASQTAKGPDGQTLERRAVFTYWFVSENRLTARHRERVLWGAKDLVTTGVLQRWAYVSCLSGCPPGQEGTVFEQMKEFIAASVPEFQLVSGPKLSDAKPTTAASLR